MECQTTQTQNLVGLFNKNQPISNLNQISMDYPTYGLMIITFHYNFCLCLCSLYFFPKSFIKISLLSLPSIQKFNAKVEDRNNEAKPQGEVERLWDIIGKCAN
jgi:hypothetical protein